MKSILSLASLTCLCSSLAYAAPEPISGLVGTITFTAKATISEGGVTKETKTEEAHQNAIDNNQDSTRTETYTPAVERFGNREILQATLETDDIKGWSLIFLESEAFSGLVAYKKGQTPIPVPESMVSFELAGFGPGLESGLFPYKQTETFTAKNHTTKGS
ncbi:MAG TPA: hypothetical protein VK968_16315, partial [Roseimicrobium sp.]|nr:hypothetical protein [Roseimicrobium sp.]